MIRQSNKNTLDLICELNKKMITFVEVTRTNIVKITTNGTLSERVVIVCNVSHTNNGVRHGKLQPPVYGTARTGEHQSQHSNWRNESAKCYAVFVTQRLCYTTCKQLTSRQFCEQYIHTENP